jgi:hypothetical protein
MNDAGQTSSIEDRGGIGGISWLLVPFRGHSVVQRGPHELLAMCAVWISNRWKKARKKFQSLEVRRRGCAPQPPCLRASVVRVRRWALLPVVVCLLGCTAREEIAAPGSPLYARAVDESVAEQNKGDGGDEQAEVAGQRKASLPPTAKDVAILGFIRNDQAARGASTTNKAVYVYWLESTSQFTRTPPTALRGEGGGGDYFVFWSEDQKKFMQVPLKRGAPVKKQVNAAYQLVLSRADENFYVYWCPSCKACHKEIWHLAETDDQVPVPSSKPAAGTAH